MAFCTIFPSYNAVNDGAYLDNWDAVVEHLENPLRINTDVEDFKRMKKTNGKQAIALKFKNGGYDAGACPMVKDLKTGEMKPSRAKGVPRPEKYNMVVLDADTNLGEDFDQKVQETLGEYEYFSHATISSTAAEPRRRILIPTAEPIDADTREAFIRYIANKVGMESFDKASVRNKQMMTFPVFCKNGDEFSFHNKGKFIDTSFMPDGWQDATNHPRWADESEAKIKNRGKRERKYYEETGEWKPVPDKNRLHAAYNATYRMSDILKEYGYTQTANGRYSHAGSCSSGIKVTNDSIAYSYYGSDPLSVERDLDAFEVKLILTYGDIADKECWKQMLAEAGADEKVKETMIKSIGIELPAEAESWASMYDSTEEGLAKRAMSMYPHKIRNGKWYRYENGIYRKVKDEAMLTDALQIIRIASALQPDDDVLRDMVGKVSIAKNILSAWKSMASIEEIPADKWEEKPWLLHFTDTCIDLEAYCKGEPFRVPHNPEHLLTQTTGYPWAEVESVDVHAMDELIKGIETYLPNEKLRNYCQMALGRCLTADASMEDKCVWLLSASSGRDGGNGKSTMLAAICAALGGDRTSSYYYPMKGKYLYYSSNDRDAEAPTPMLAGMASRRMTNFVEYDGLRTLDGEKYKSYTAAGQITARNCNSDNDSFRAKCVCVVDANGMPGLKRKEYSLLRRTRVIPFNAELSGDSSVKKRWTHDHNIAVAMMAWLLMGLHAWYANGCNLDHGIKDENIPEEVYKETMGWYNSFDDPSEFFEDYYEITRDTKDFLIADQCWEIYEAQVYDRGATRHMFRQAEERWLREHGITQKQKKVVNNYGLRRMCYVGVRMIGTYESTHTDYGKYNEIKGA